MSIFKKKVYIVKRTTNYTNGQTKERIIGVTKSKKKTIACIRGYLKGCIAGCKGKPIMEPYCITKIPSENDIIKAGRISWFQDNDRIEWISYEAHELI